MLILPWLVLTQAGRRFARATWRFLVAAKGVLAPDRVQRIGTIDDDFYRQRMLRDEEILRLHGGL